MADRLERIAQWATISQAIPWKWIALAVGGAVGAAIALLKWLVGGNTLAIIGLAAIVVLCLAVAIRVIGGLFISVTTKNPTSTADTVNRPTTDSRVEAGFSVPPFPLSSAPADPNPFTFLASEEPRRGLQAILGPAIPDTRECGAEDTLSDLDTDEIMRRLEAAPTDLVRKAIAEEYIGRCFMWDGRVERYSGAAASPVQITGRGSPLALLPLLTFEVAAARVAGLPPIFTGDHVRIVGRIRSIDEIQIALGGCRVEGPLRKPSA